MNKLLRTLTLGCLLVSPALAQEPAQPEKKPARGRAAYFVYTSMPEGLENPVSVLSGNELSQIVLSKLSPSDPVKIPADGIIRIVRKIPNQEDPKKPAYLTLAQATVPESVSDAMVILMPIAKNPNGLLFQAKVQDLAALKGGDTMFLNMTTLKIGIELGGAKIGVGPGQVNIHNPLGTAKTVSLPIKFSYYDAAKEEWRLITASTVALYSTRRELCIFNWDSRFGRVDYESITFPLLESAP
jgi:hypothetical protein